MDEPTAYLVPPAEPDASISQGFANPIGFLDALSISHWINEIIKDLAGYDIIGSATAAFTGDWATFYKAGDAFANLGRCLHGIGINATEGLTRLDPQWDGRAADAAYAYFANLAGAVSQQQYVLDEIREQYHKAARGIWLFADMVAGLLKLIIDKAIIAGISAAAGTATAETGIGAVVGYGVAAWQAMEILKLVNQAATKIQAAGTLIGLVFGVLVGLANQGGDLSKYPLPAVPYAHPGPAPG